MEDEGGKGLTPCFASAAVCVGLLLLSQQIITNLTV